MPLPDDPPAPTADPARATSKAGLRREIVSARRSRSAPEIDAARSAVRSAVLAEQASQGWRCVAAYVPMATEPGSTELLDELVGRGVRVLVPVLHEDGVLGWTSWDPARPVRWDGQPAATDGAATDGAATDGAATDGAATDGAATDGAATDTGPADRPTPESLGTTRAAPAGQGPATIATADVVLVPALAVAADGSRLGRGLGCYDRALRLARPSAPLVAVVFDDERRDRVPTDPWDVAVTAVVSPQGWRDLDPPR